MRAVASVLILLVCVSAAGAGSFRVDGNFDLSGEIRRDAHMEYDDRPLGYDRAFRPNYKRPQWNMEIFDPKVELRAYAFPVAPVEIYSKILYGERGLTDFWLSEAHTKLNFGSWDDKRKGIETYFFYRQGRLSLGDPLLYVIGDGFGTGVATSWWLGRDMLTIKGGKWSGEFNLQNGTDEQKNLYGEDNDAFSGKLRHDYRFNMDFNIANEVYFAQKNYWYDYPRYLLYRNYAIGTAFMGNYKTTSFSVQYNAMSNEQEGVSIGTPDNGAIGVDLRNLLLLDKPWSGRIGVNASFLYFGTKYHNYLGGKGSEWMGFGDQIINGSYTAVGDNVSKDLYTELFWDVPKYEVNIAYRHQDKEGMRLWPGRRLSRRNEIDMNAKLIGNLYFRFMANRTSYGLERVLMDFDANRFIRDRRLVQSQMYTSLKLQRTWGSVMADAHYFRRRSVDFKIGGLEASYMFSKKLKILGRSAWLFIDRPDMNWTITNMPSDIAPARPTTSVVDPFFTRNSAFFQLQYKPSDNSQIWVEYGQGWHTDDNLSLDGNLIDATRRTDPRVFMKMEMWF